MSYGPDECKRQGGGKVTFAPDTVRKLDLNGDGLEDYIISYGDTECAGRLEVYCGTAGCSLEILVTLPNGRQRMVFSDRAWTYEILPGEGARTSASICTAPIAAPSTSRMLEGAQDHHKPFQFVEPKD